jgi:hypothetical protein
VTALRDVFRLGFGKRTPELVWLDIRNTYGSVEHYYHFLLGYLLPLCAYAGQRGDDSSILLARSCGPMSHLVTELGIPGLILCERKSYREFSRRVEELGLTRVELSGLDLEKRPTQYDAERVARVVSQAKAYIRQRLGGTIDALRDKLEADWTASPRLVIIRREDPDPYYLSKLSEVKGGGASRRTIANMPALIEALTARYAQTKVVSLEDQSLAEQIALFETADVVVGQHGAALANVVWMRPDAHVFEYINEPKHTKYFRDLSLIFGIRHHTLMQEDALGPVDIDALVEATMSALSARGLDEPGRQD